MSRLYVHSIHLFLSIALVYIAYNAQIIGVKQEYFFIFSLVLIPLLLPVVDHITRSIEKIFGSSITPDAYIDTIDTIIQLNSIDELLNTQFNQILRLLGLHEGTMIFHDREREEYTIFLKTIEPDSMTKKGTLDSENILIKILNSPEDIILKSRISGHLSIERNLINLMEMYKAEIIIPMYFSGMLTGAMLLGKKSSDYNNDEISALKIFASKIASLSINSMFWKELVRKRELEKEKRMELRVQKAFLPAEKLITENVEIAVFFNMNDVLFDRFHTLFSYNGLSYFISYRTNPEHRSTLIFLPTVAVLIRTFITSGMSIEEAIRITKNRIMERHMFDIPPDIFACSITQDRKLDYINETTIEPMLFKNFELEKPEKESYLSKGDIFIYTNNHIKRVFENFKYEVLAVFTKHRNKPAQDIKSALISFLNSKKIIREKSFFSLFIYRGSK
jgi:hypothetical protein